MHGCSALIIAAQDADNDSLRHINVTERRDLGIAVTVLRKFVSALWAALWGLVAGSALIVGALACYFARTPQRLVAAIMAFGSGVLISALSFDLMDEAYRRGGFDSTAIGL